MRFGGFHKMLYANFCLRLFKHCLFIRPVPWIRVSYSKNAFKKCETNNCRSGLPCCLLWECCQKTSCLLGLCLARRRKQHTHNKNIKWNSEFSCWIFYIRFQQLALTWCMHVLPPRKSRLKSCKRSNSPGLLSQLDCTQPLSRGGGVQGEGEEGPGVTRVSQFWGSRVLGNPGFGNLNSDTVTGSPSSRAHHSLACTGCWGNIISGDKFKNMDKCE